jgi:type IV pilus assembly protein PilQ
MRIAVRATATATALALAWAAAVGCSSSRGKGAPSAADVAAASTTPASASSSSTAPAPTAKITQAALNQDADGARVVLSANAPLLYTSYEPRPDLLIVDLRDATPAESFVIPKATGGIVESIKIEELDELGKRITRLSIGHRAEAKVDVRSVGQGLAVAFSETTAVASTEAESPAEPAPAREETPAPAAAAVASAPLPAPPAAMTASVAPAPAARGEMAHALEKVAASAADGHVAVTLQGDGWFAPKDFVLSNPPRVVVDLPGVKNEVKQRSIAVSGDLVTRVRVSQFATSPEYVTRVVVDLARPVPHALSVDGERLAVLVGENLSIASTAPAPAPAHVEAASPSTTSLAAAPEPAPTPPAVHEDAPVSVATAAAPAEEPAHLAQAPAPPPAAMTPAVSEPAKVETAKAEPAKTELAKIEPAKAEPAVEKPAPPPAPTQAVETKVVTAPPVPPPAAPSKPAPAPARPKSSRGDALFEAAAAQLDQDQATQPAGGGSAYRSRTISEAPTQFTGEPISLDLKDADIKDVFRTISQLTGLNIVIDPEVRGTVTVQLEDVPWDQALDLILKQNSLGYVLENNIMRIATTAKLQAEEGDRARLAEARQAAEPTRTVIKKLSYAKASEIVPTLQSVMSKRGSIVVDQRTNTLIIREIPTYLPAVLQLIDNLDTATPQVVIESRIVETTKSLGRSLGINWSVRGKADVEHGNTTNLIFPNTVDAGLNVGLGNGPTVASLVLGNILNTFNLDVALTAAENQGLLKIISSPKVTSLTNTPALIQSGVQIPVQTTVNNTTTVIYVDATLKLDVTPQITAEGTILLTVNVTKREPAVALNLSLGQNVPLTIREYRGQVLVKDGGTTVIGGIFQINDQDQNNMIPGLWKIPVLGNLFRNKTRTEKHDELLIFITPRILRS